MALTDQIAADQQAVTDAQSALAAAESKLAADQAQLDALQPHVGVLGEIEAKAAQFGPAALEEFAALTAKLKALLGL